ncbi:unnamed protein product, partial [Mesorhabditis spiculigera]
MGPKLFIITEDVDDAKEILVKKFECFTDRQEMDFLSDSLKNAIINQKGKRWRHSRAQLSPAFSTAKIRAMSHSVHKHMDILSTLLHRNARSGQAFDIYDLYKRLTLSVISECAFGLSSDCLQAEDCPFAFHAATYFRQLPSPENSSLMALSVIIPEFAPICEWLHTRISDAGRSETWLAYTLSQVIEHRMQTGDTSRPDVISILLASGLGREEIVNNGFAFLLAGYETTSTALGFATWLLARHPDVQQKLYEELMALPDPEQIHQYYDQVMRLPYLNAVYKEALRLFPPITFFVNRTCTRDCEIGGVLYTRGTQVGIPIWNILRSSDVWEKPNDFIPERFLDAPTNPFAWLPFGAGPRSCIGMRFAQMEFKIAIARTLSVFTLRLPENSKWALPLTNSTALLSTPEIQVICEPRRK